MVVLSFAFLLVVLNQESLHKTGCSIIQVRRTCCFSSSISKLEFDSLEDRNQFSVKVQIKKLRYQLMEWLHKRSISSTFSPWEERIMFLNSSLRIGTLREQTSYHTLKKGLLNPFIILQPPKELQIKFHKFGSLKF